MNELFEIVQVYAIIDPITAGFLISSAVKIGSSLLGGPDEDDTKEALDAATRVSHAQKQRTAQETDLARQQNQAKSESMMKSATSSGEKSLSELVGVKQSAITTGDFELDESAVAKADNTRTDVYEKYGDTVDQIVQEQNFTKQSIDLNTKKQIDAIEHEMDTTVSSILSTPDTFLEKFTGISNYKAGA
jgi:hypothetical protein